MADYSENKPIWPGSLLQVVHMIIGILEESLERFHRFYRTNYKLYVVSDDLDFDKELGKMITLESMRM